MELAHRHALEELQRQHAREKQELQQERDRLLQEETQATEKGSQTDHVPKFCDDPMITASFVVSYDTDLYMAYNI